MASSSRSRRSAAADSIMGGEARRFQGRTSPPAAAINAADIDAAPEHDSTKQKRNPRGRFVKGFIDNTAHRRTRNPRRNRRTMNPRRTAPEVDVQEDKLEMVPAPAPEVEVLPAAGEAVQDWIEAKAEELRVALKWRMKRKIQRNKKGDDGQGQV